MISFEEAIEIALDDAGDGMTIDPRATIEKPYGWVFFPNTCAYFESGDPMEAVLGSGGILVLRDSGRKIQFGSAFGVEENLKIFELGYLDHDNWDIVITRVLDERAAIDVILGLGATYVIPEFASGIEWRVPKAYTRHQIKELIRTPPVRLNLGAIYFNYQYIEGLKRQTSLEYRLEPNQGFVNSI